MNQQTPAVEECWGGTWVTFIVLASTSCQYVDATIPHLYPNSDDGALSFCSLPNGRVSEEQKRSTISGRSLLPWVNLGLGMQRHSESVHYVF